jgi:transcriptional regulator with XRE-family HTH domain
MALESCARNAPTARPGSIPNSKQLGIEIRERREEKDLTIEGLAGAAGVDTSYLSDIERLGKNPSWEKLASIVRALDIDASALVLRAEEIAQAESGSEG